MVHYLLLNIDVDLDPQSDCRCYVGTLLITIVLLFNLIVFMHYLNIDIHVSLGVGHCGIRVVINTHIAQRRYICLSIMLGGVAMGNIMS